jgi:hypothetical protein
MSSGTIISSYLDKVEAAIKIRKSRIAEAEPVTFQSVRAALDAAIASGPDGDVASHLDKVASGLDALRKNYEGPTPVPDAAAMPAVEDASTVVEVAAPDLTVATVAATSFSSNEVATSPAPAVAAPTGPLLPAPAGASGAPFATPAIGKSWKEMDQEFAWPANYGLSGKPRGLSGTE